MKYFRCRNTKSGLEFVAPESSLRNLHSNSQKTSEGVELLYECNPDGSKINSVTQEFKEPERIKIEDKEPEKTDDRTVEPEVFKPLPKVSNKAKISKPVKKTDKSKK